MLKKVIKFLKNRVRHLKLFDWVLVFGGLTLVIVFMVLFFRKSSYITISVLVGEDSASYGSWSSWSDNSGPKYWFANAFHKGQMEKDGLGKVQAEVLDVFSYDNNPSHKTVYLNLRIKAVYNRATNAYTYNGTPVLICSTIKLNFNNVFANSLVTNVQGFPDNVIDKKLIVEARIFEDNVVFPGTEGTKEFIANAVQKGDIVYDNNGNELIKILDKKSVPAEITVTTSDGRVIKKIDPLKKDVTFNLEIVVKKINDKYFFLGNIPILINQPVPINLPTVSVFPYVTKILSEN